MEIFGKRNGTKGLTGDDASTLIAALCVAIFVVLLLGLWEYVQWSTGSLAYYSYPSDIAYNLYFFADSDLKRFLDTGIRGSICLIVAFVIAYPLGALLPCFGKLTKFFGVLICLALMVPKLAVTLLTMRLNGYGESSILIMGLWTGWWIMLCLGFLNSLDLHTRTDALGEVMEASAMDCPYVWQHYWEVVLPLLRPSHISSLYALSGYIWTTTSFAEVMVGGNVTGLGERMNTKSLQDASIGHFYSASFLLLSLGIITWGIIYLLFSLIPSLKSKLFDKK